MGEGPLWMDDPPDEDLEETHPGYLTFEYGEGCRLFVRELEDGRLDMTQVFIVDDSNPDRTEPIFKGEIDTEPAFFRSIPVETVVSGDWVFDEAPACWLEHIVFVRVEKLIPMWLDFEVVYGFNTHTHEFYRVKPIAVTDPDKSPPESHVLRFQPAEHGGFFYLDDADHTPAPESLAEQILAREQGWDNPDRVDPRRAEALRAHLARHPEDAPPIVQDLPPKWLRWHKVAGDDSAPDILGSKTTTDLPFIQHSLAAAGEIPFPEFDSAGPGRRAAEAVRADREAAIREYAAIDGRDAGAGVAVDAAAATVSRDNVRAEMKPAVEEQYEEMLDVGNDDYEGADTPPVDM